jgi:16S rRNA (adenine1518-N6/adenine1519-N6)-dimethyltransferase
MMEHPSKILQRLQGRARKRFGQHFLASQDVVDQIVATSRASAGDRVLEIGPGLGIMTDRLLKTGAEVTAMELDRDLGDYLEERFPELTLHRGDALKQDWGTLLSGGGWKCVSNLPYNVGTKIVTQLVQQSETFSSLVVMLQREVGERMAAPAGDRKRGSLHIEAYARCRVALRVKPGAFHPPPKVESVVLSLVLRDKPLLGGASPKVFAEVVRAGFSTQRKAVHNPLGRIFDKAEVKIALAEAGVSPMARPGVMTLEQWGAVACRLEGSQRNTK